MNINREWSVNRLDFDIAVLSDNQGVQIKPLKKRCLIYIFSRHFWPKRFTVIHTYIHTLMAVAATQVYWPAHQEQLRLQCLAQGHFFESN